ncbi:MAG: UDP-N-acetylmuramoyl-L-alanyl-D-glutamate--2,6-diaminopimelate ligase [Acidimicrobiales bacterium]
MGGPASTGAKGVEVSCVTFDTRDVRPGALHCCLPGSHADGHDFAREAVVAGAVALICEQILPAEQVPSSVVQVCVGKGGARAAMAQAASAFWSHPSEALQMVGVTGTSGKTTVTHLLRSVLEAHGWPTAVIGTLGGPLTTPESPALQEALARHHRLGGRAVAMEVSSHALVQHRVDSIHYDAVAFTNLSRDHLDYHATMEDYFEAKAALFAPNRAEVGLANLDDPWGQRLIERALIPTSGYSVSEAADVVCERTSTRFSWRGHPVRLALAGRFNVTNAVAAARLAGALGVPDSTIAEGISAVQGVPGRYEAVERGQPFTVIVDYAHKPDALAQVLLSARETAGAGARLIVVFGCGGERDRGKRPLMGELATSLADLVVLTSDNPRSEDPAEIIAEIFSGVRDREAIVVEPDRAAAITMAIATAAAGDVVVIAGKGHESGQDTGAGRIDLDDRRVAAAAIDARGDRPG